MKRIAVYCGSSMGASETYKEGAIQLAKELVNREITLVYGGASVGLMGVVADAVLQAGGKVIGVIPHLLEEREISHRHLTELHIVHTMHERKEKMANLADGFIALPGGPGTLEEFAEIYTWAQLGLHQKPIGLLNIDGFYDPLMTFFSHMLNEQFLQKQYQSMAIIDANPKSLIDQFKRYKAPTVKTYVKDH